MKDNEIIDFYIEEALDNISNRTKKTKGIISLRKTPRLNRMSTLSTGLISSNQAIMDAIGRNAHQETKRSGSVTKRNKPKEKAFATVLKRKRVLLIRSNNADLEASFKDVADNEEAEDAIIAHFIGTVGEDIMVLNEDKFIPTFDRMLNLMLPSLDSGKSKLKKHRSKNYA
mmetsp:Transcript_33035/g.37911  ORF Transcript_33035/g.37911 Transcript_33035/m.37911 type:complete len:171 (-) Transcript_33035:15-527(-)